MLQLPFKLTNSNMAIVKNCPKMFQYRILDKLTPKYKTEARGIGTAFHRGVETGSICEALYTFDGIFPNSQEEQDALDIKRATVQAMVEGYFEAFERFENIESEIEFDLPIINPRTNKPSKSFTLAGKVDGLVKIGGKYWLLELKTAGQINSTYIDKLMIDSQITTYFYALQRHKNINLSGVIYRIVKKPSIRQTKKETVQQYCERLIEDYKFRPDFYFFEEKLYRSNEDMKLYERELWMFTQYLLQCNREGLWYRNTSRCADWGKCDYLPLCTGQLDAMDLYEVREPNEELEGEESNNVA